MKLAPNGIKTLYWHLRGFIRAHQPHHPRELDHFNRFYRVDKLTEICERLEEEKKTYDQKIAKPITVFYEQRDD